MNMPIRWKVVAIQLDVNHWIGTRPCTLPNMAISLHMRNVKIKRIADFAGIG
jgi:hypothetical protein